MIKLFAVEIEPKDRHEDMKNKTFTKSIVCKRDVRGWEKRDTINRSQGRGDEEGEDE